MPLSIFNSKLAPFFCARVLVGICVILIVALEIFSDYSPKHQFETFAYISRQYADAVGMSPAKSGELISGLCEERIRHLLEANRTSTPTEIKAKILNALVDFSRSNWHDDATLPLLAVS